MAKKKDKKIPTNYFIADAPASLKDALISPPNEMQLNMKYAARLRACIRKIGIPMNYDYSDKSDAYHYSSIEMGLELECFVNVFN